MGVRVVRSMEFHPGQCAVIPSGHGPFVDTERVDGMGRRIYLSVEALNEAQTALDAAGAGRACKERAALEKRVGELEAANGELEAKALELEKLRDSVRSTLEVGAVRDGRSGKQKLRAAPGQKRVEV